MIISIACTILRVPITRLMAQPGTPNADFRMLYWANSLFLVMMFVCMFAYYKFGNWEKYVVVRGQKKPAGDREDI